MTGTGILGGQTAMWMRATARALALAWAGFWVFFGVASGIGEGGGVWATVAHTAVPGLAFLAIAIAIWRWETAGAVVLLLAGALVALGYPMMVRGRFPLSTIVFVLATMAVPPLLAGLLLLAGRRRAPA